MKAKHLIIVGLILGVTLAGAMSWMNKEPSYALTIQELEEQVTISQNNLENVLSTLNIAELENKDILSSLSNKISAITSISDDISIPHLSYKDFSSQTLFELETLKLELEYKRYADEFEPPELTGDEVVDPPTLEFITPALPEEEQISSSLPLIPFPLVAPEAISPLPFIDPKPSADTANGAGTKHDTRPLVYVGRKGERIKDCRELERYLEETDIEMDKEADNLYNRVFSTQQAYGEEVAGMPADETLEIARADATKAREEFRESWEEEKARILAKIEDCNKDFKILAELFFDLPASETSASTPTTTGNPAADPPRIEVSIDEILEKFDFVPDECLDLQRIVLDAKFAAEDLSKEATELEEKFNDQSIQVDNGELTGGEAYRTGVESRKKRQAADDAWEKHAELAAALEECKKKHKILIGSGEQNVEEYVTDTYKVDYSLINEQIDFYNGVSLLQFYVVADLYQTFDAWQSKVDEIIENSSNIIEEVDISIIKGIDESLISWEKDLKAVIAESVLVEFPADQYISNVLVDESIIAITSWETQMKNVLKETSFLSSIPNSMMEDITNTLADIKDKIGDYTSADSGIIGTSEGADDLISPPQITFTHGSAGDSCMDECLRKSKLIECKVCIEDGVEISRVCTESHNEEEKRKACAEECEEKAKDTQNDECVADKLQKVVAPC